MITELLWHPLVHTLLVSGAILLGARWVAQALAQPQVYNVTNVLPIDRETDNALAKVVNIADHTN